MKKITDTSTAMRLSCCNSTHVWAHGCEIAEEFSCSRVGKKLKIEEKKEKFQRIYSYFQSNSVQHDKKSFKLTWLNPHQHTQTPLRSHAQVRVKLCKFSQGMFYGSESMRQMREIKLNENDTAPCDLNFFWNQYTLIFFTHTPTTVTHACRQKITFSLVHIIKKKSFLFLSNFSFTFCFHSYFPSFSLSFSQFLRHSRCGEEERDFFCFLSVCCKMNVVEHSWGF